MFDNNIIKVDSLRSQLSFTREAISYGEADRKLVLENSARVSHKILELEQVIEEWTKKSPSSSQRETHQQWIEAISAKKEELSVQRELQQAMINWWKKKGEEVEEWYAELAVPTPGYWEDERLDLAELSEGR